MASDAAVLHALLNGDWIVSFAAGSNSVTGESRQPVLAALGGRGVCGYEPRHCAGPVGWPR